MLRLIKVAHRMACVAHIGHRKSCQSFGCLRASCLVESSLHIIVAHTLHACSLMLAYLAASHTRHVCQVLLCELALFMRAIDGLVITERLPIVTSPLLKDALAVESLCCSLLRKRLDTILYDL